MLKQVLETHIVMSLKLGFNLLRFPDLMRVLVVAPPLKGELQSPKNVKVIFLLPMGTQELNHVGDDQLPDDSTLPLPWSTTFIRQIFSLHTIRYSNKIYRFSMTEGLSRSHWAPRTYWPRHWWISAVSIKWLSRLSVIRIHNINHGLIHWCPKASSHPGCSTESFQLNSLSAQASCTGHLAFFSHSG